MTVDDYTNRIVDIYNECVDALSDNSQLTGQRIAAAVDAPLGDVLVAMDEPADTEPLSCISTQLLKVLGEYMNAVSAVVEKVSELIEI